MTNTSHGQAAGHHPAPHRARVNVALLLIGVGGGPAAWLTQQSVNYGFAAQACFVRTMRQSVVAPGWEAHQALLWIVNIGAVLVALLCAAISWRYWRRTQEEVKQSSHHHLLDVGEGRTRFLALCGVISSIAFLATILFNTTGLIVVPQCPG